MHHRNQKLERLHTCSAFEVLLHKFNKTLRGIVWILCPDSTQKGAEKWARVWLWTCCAKTLDGEEGTHWFSQGRWEGDAWSQRHAGLQRAPTGRKWRICSQVLGCQKWIFRTWLLSYCLILSAFNQRLLSVREPLLHGGKCSLQSRIGSLWPESK